MYVPIPFPTEHFILTHQPAKSTSKHKISLVLLNVLKWPIFAPVAPRLALLAFTFCQPLLLRRFLDYLQDPVERQDANIGYGLIGAYFLVYFGMAVSCPEPDFIQC